MILSFKQGTDIHFVRSTENAVVKGLPYTLLTLAAGWYGIPSGPIFSVMALFNNPQGGKDVTKEVMNILNVHPAPSAAETMAAQLVEQPCMRACLWHPVKRHAGSKAVVAGRKACSALLMR